MSNYRGYNSGASGNGSGSYGSGGSSYGNSGRAGGSYGSPSSAAGGAGGIRRYGAASSRYNTNGGGSSNYGDNSQQRQYDDSDEEVDFIKTKIAKAKQDTLDSTRNALRTLQQTEEVGVKTLTKLGEQTEQLNRIDRTMEMTSLQAENSVEQTGKLRTLNKSIFHVHVKNPFSGKKRREAELAKLEAEQERVRLAEERKLQNDHESRNRIGRFTNPNGPRPAGAPGRMTADGHTIVSDTSMSRSERSKYTFDEDEDPEIENEINDNMNEMSSALGRLKELSLATQRELNAQDDPLRRITDTTDKTSDNIGVARYQLSRIK